MREWNGRTNRFQGFPAWALLLSALVVALPSGAGRPPALTFPQCCPWVRSCVLSIHIHPALHPIALCSLPRLSFSHSLSPPFVFFPRRLSRGSALPSLGSQLRTPPFPRFPDPLPSFSILFPPPRCAQPPARVDTHLTVHHFDFQVLLPGCHLSHHPSGRDVLSPLEASSLRNASRSLVPCVRGVVGTSRPILFRFSALLKPSW